MSFGNAFEAIVATVTVATLHRPGRGRNRRANTSLEPKSRNGWREAAKGELRDPVQEVSRRTGFGPPYARNP